MMTISGNQTNWEIKKLSDVLELHYGKGLKKEDRQDGPFPVFGSSGVVGSHNASLATGPGIVVGRKGNVGSVFWSESDFFVIDTAYYVSSTLPLRFLYYLLPTLNFINGDSAVPGLSRNQAYSLEVIIPPPNVQQRIAGILSAYDELIDNSQQRIKILESMARALYREWFVYFRFPGHESVPLVPSSLGDIPQGWEVTTLDEHLSGLESGKRPKGGIRDIDDGVPSIGAENINGLGQHDFAAEKFIPREFFQEMRKGIVRDRDVAIYKDGAYIGKSSYFRDGFPHSECCVNEHVFLLRASGVRLKQNALYLWLQEPDTVQTIRSKNANAAQPGINKQTVGGLNLILPDSKTATHFDQLVDPLLAEVINLAKSIQNLRRTRDLLLPRLLSGQIDVEAIAS